MKTIVVCSLAMVALLGAAATARAQETESRFALDTSAGYAGFVDEAPIEHFAIGLGARWRLSPRVSVGPEAVFMKGPGSDRDLFVTGKVMVDFMPQRLASPYFIADGGMMFHADDFYRSAFWTREGAVSGGLGVRVNLTPRISIAPEFRIGWEPHLRIGAVVTWHR